MRTLLAASVLLLGLAACGGRDPDDILALDGDPAAGAEVFASRCARCHGDDGRGTERGPDLAEEVPDASDEDLVDQIVNGGWDMPAIDVTDQEAADVLAFLRETFGGG